MILVEFTINSVVNRISDEYCYLTHQWVRKIKDLTPPRYSIKNYVGGYVEPESGKITLSPDLFASDYPPPVSCAISIYITDTTEEAAVLMFSGTAHLESIGQSEISYGLFGEEYSLTLSEKTYIDDTLSDVFDTYCASAYLGLTLNTTYARVTQPSVYNVFEEGEIVIDMLSKLAEATNHLFYIKNGTLYLVDTLLSNGSALTPGIKIYPPEYKYLPAYKQYTSEAIKKYKLAGSYAYGSVESSDVANSIEHLYGRFGNNSGNDQLWLMHRSLFVQYETGKTYRLSIKVRRSSGSANIVAGWLGYGADRSTIIDRNGGTDYTLACWHCASAPDLSAYSSDWLTKTGYTRATSAPASIAEAPIVSSPGTMYTGTAYIRPVIILNSSAAAGVMDLDYIAIYEVDGDGNILEEILYNDLTDSAQLWEWTNVSGSGNRGIYTSVAASASAMATHLGNRKTILERPQITLKMDLLAANVPVPGQPITFTDTMAPPDNSVAGIDVTLYTRNISFDLANYKIIVSGDGVIA